MNKKRNSSMSVALLALVLVSGVAYGHAIQLFVYVDGPVVRGVANYFGGAAVATHAIEVLDRDGALMTTIMTDDEGRFVFTPEQPVDHIFRVTTDEGHRAAYEIKGEWLGHAEAGEAVAPANHGELASLEARIDQLEKTLRFRDVLGGIGYIVGVMGLLFWWKARQPGKG